ncbi:MAG: hypothetical protein AUG51_25210 [Acidobacteria bacterium 13_1_20CM_3_53_8]|nr:MAG: hypothetical protein AUG51_25210 [Acidobacteria bacterium 13_1_20CM_3_53_8]
MFNPLPSPLIVRACKFDGSLHRSWRAELVRQDSSLLVLDAMFEAEVNHQLMGTIARGTVSLEYYWLDRWYNIFRFINPDGELRNYYCNVNMPPTLDGEVLSYIDLDIDVLVEPDFSYKVLDQDEFEENAERYNYPEHVRRNARQAVTELIELIEDRKFPFND